MIIILVYDMGMILFAKIEDYSYVKCPIAFIMIGFCVIIAYLLCEKIYRKRKENMA